MYILMRYLLLQSTLYLKLKNQSFVTQVNLLKAGHFTSHQIMFIARCLTWHCPDHIINLFTTMHCRLSCFVCLKVSARFQVPPVPIICPMALNFQSNVVDFLVFIDLTLFINLGKGAKYPFIHDSINLQTSP